ncbi:MAG: helix-turn-helix transcriptional regulator [Pseudomonadota bacterium]
MSNTKARPYSRYSQQAVTVMGKMIRLERMGQKMTAKDLADRAGISRTTLQKIESGNMKCKIGIVFEVAALVGVKLFDADTGALESLQERINDKIALLPKSVRVIRRPVDDDF